MITVTTPTISAIQEAIDSLGSSGGVVCLPAGLYEGDAGIIIRQAGTRLVGDGPSSTVIQVNGDDQTGIRADVSSLRRRCQIWDLAVTMTGARAKAIDLTRMSYWSLDRLSIDLQGQGGAGVFGTAAAGDSPYYGQASQVDIRGNGSGGDCVGWLFRGDPESAYPRRSPNANTIRGGRVYALGKGIVDRGMSNSWTDIVLESCHTHMEMGADCSVEEEYSGKIGTTNQTIIRDTYHEGGTRLLVVHNSATNVRCAPRFVTGIPWAEAIQDDGRATTWDYICLVPTRPPTKIPGYRHYTGPCSFDDLES